MKNPILEWPKGFLSWQEDEYACISIPFTWELPKVRDVVTANQGRTYFVGGPAVKLIPDYFADLPNVTVGDSLPGILQRFNPLATRTTTGCIRHCSFCAIGTGAVEPGGIKELSDWPDLPIICDNNLLAASEQHFKRVVDRLVPWEWADFNQGLDARLLTLEHAKQLKRIKTAMVRLALDSDGCRDQWESAYQCLRKAKIIKRNIRTYALVGFRDSPQEAWARCEWINAHEVRVLPQWFHGLKQLTHNEVTEEQQKLGWTNDDRTAIMGWYYQRRRPKKGYFPL